MLNNDELLQKIANEYVENYGRELHEENKTLNMSEQASAEMAAEYRLEMRVFRKVTSEKRRPYLALLPLLAACIAITFVYLPNLFSTPSQTDPHPIPIPSPADPAPAPEPADPAPQPLPQTPQFEIIPLSVPLPQGFTQIGFEQDRGQSIYYIEDVYLDNVVVTLEAGAVPSDISGLVEIWLGGEIAYVKQTDAYSLLTFTNDDILYTLTSRYDINTLLRLGIALI